MTINQVGQRRVAIFEEPDGSYAVDHTGTPGDFLDLPIVHGSLKVNPGFQMKDPMTQKQYLLSHDKLVPGRQRPTVSFDIVLAPLGTAFGASTTTFDTDDSAILRMLKIVFGGFDGGVNAGSAVAGTPSNAYTIPVTTGHGSRFTAKTVVGLVDSNGRVEHRKILSKSTDDLNLYHGGTFTPADTSAVYNTCSVWMTGRPDTTLQMITEGAGTHDRWKYLGGYCTSANLTLGNDEFPKLSLTFEFVHMEALSSQAITLASYLNFSPQWKTGKLLIAPYSASGGQTATELCAQDRSFGLALQQEPLFCSSAEYGVRRPFRPRVDPPVFTFTIPDESNTYYDAVLSGAEFQISQQINDDPDNSLSIFGTRCQVINCEPVGDSLDQQTVTLRPIPIANASSDLSRSPVTIHF